MVAPVIPVSTSAVGTGQELRIDRIRVNKSTVTTTNASFRIHLLKVAPTTVANGDNGAFSTNGVSGYLGFFDITAMQAFTDGASGFIATGANAVVRARGDDARTASGADLHRRLARGRAQADQLLGLQYARLIRAR